MSVEPIRALATALRARQPRKNPSPPDSPRRASVAAILRLLPAEGTTTPDTPLPATVEGLLAAPWAQSAEAQLFFIRRAANPRDRWSSHMAFPGGKAERGETDRQAAVRETREETGLLLDTPAFTWIGELDDRDIIVPNTGRHIMVLSCHVFVQLAPATPPTRLQTSEVAGTHWIPLSYLHMPRPSDWRPVPMRIAHYAIPPTMLVASPWQIRVRRSLADAITLLAGDCVFRGIAVPGDPPGSFPIWGMTLWLLSDLLAVADGVPVDSPAALVVGGFPKYTSPDVHWIVSVLTLGRYPSRLFFDDGKASSGLQMHNAVALGIFISMAWKTAAIAQVVRYTPRLIRWLRASL